MKRFILAIALGALTLGLLGSCTQQLDELDRKIEAVEACDITSIEQQIAAINGSIADLETIRQNIQSLIAADAATGDSLAKLREADAALGVRIGELRTYVDNTLSAYAKVEWANATLATLQQHEQTCDTIAGIDARIGAFDARISKLIEDSKDSLKAWVNTQLGGYYTAAELDAKLGLFKKAIEAASVSGDEKLSQLEAEITKEKNAVDSVKAAIRTGYASAVKTAIEQYEGRFTKALSDSIAAVNGKVAELEGRIGNLELAVAQLTGRVDALEHMIQKVSVVPAYEDGSLLVEKGIVTIDCIITPKEAVEGLTKDNFTVIASQALTKAAKLTSLPVAKDEDLVLDKTTGEVTVKVDVSSVLPEGSGKALTVALNVKSGLSDYTTPFSTLTVFAALKTPVVTISPAMVFKGDNTEVVISWNAVENAVKYAITTYEGGTVAIENTSYRILADEVSKLDIGKYGFSVVAKPDPSSFFLDSEACNDTLSVVQALEGAGTQADPYQVGSGAEMSRLRRVLKTGSKTYVKLVSDIDMSSVESWVPLNLKTDKSGSTEYANEIDFDGNGKTIKNFTCKDQSYASFFGVLVGECRNVTFENAKVSQAHSSSPGILGGYCGTGERGAKVSNLSLKKCTVTASINAPVGIVSGQASSSTFENVYVDSESKIEAANTTSAVGGLVGKCNGSYATAFSKCINEAAINAPKSVNAGGIVGSMNGTISECINKGSIAASQKTGGICGTNDGVLAISKCSVAADITAGGSNAGGIIGQLSIAGSSVSECWYKGTMTVKDNAGGICGAIGSTSVASAITISNCYSKGTINVAGGQKIGGIGGECYKYSVIENCYSTMALSGSGDNRVFGSIAGRFNNGGWNGGSTTDLYMKATNCIAAGSIDATATNKTFGSSGAVLGNCPAKVAHYTNCWHKYNFTFNVAYVTEGVGLVDQGYTVTSFTEGTYLKSGYTTNSNWYPYHGSEASASALKAAYSGWTTDKADAELTVSDIAAAIHSSDAQAFASDIWDLSGDYPTLKNVPEEN